MHLLTYSANVFQHIMHNIVKYGPERSHASVMLVSRNELSPEELSNEVLCKNTATLLPQCL